MPKKLYDIRIISGTYAARDGSTKNSYKVIGSLMQSDKDNRKYLLLDPTVNLAGFPRDPKYNMLTGWLSEPKEQRDSPVGQAHEFYKSSDNALDLKSSDNAFDLDEVPF